MRILVRSLIVCFLAAATSLHAITYIVPPDRELIAQAESIVIVKGVCSHAHLTANGLIVTTAQLEVVRPLKGSFQAGEMIDVTEPGGMLDDVGLLVPGSPRYASGIEYLVFVSRNPFGELITVGMGLGRFERYIDLHGRVIYTRAVGEDPIRGFDVDGPEHREYDRDAALFVKFISDSVAGIETKANYAVDASTLVVDQQSRMASLRPKPLAVTRGSYLYSLNARWQSPTAKFFAFGTQPGHFQDGGIGNAQFALSLWTSAGAGISYTYGGTTTEKDGINHNQNTIVFNDWNGIVAMNRAFTGNPTIAAIGMSWISSPYSLGGEQFRAIVGANVEVGTGLEAFTDHQFSMMLAHELGNTLGFRNSDGTGDPDSPSNGHNGCSPPSAPNDPQPLCTTVAVMSETANASFSSLQTYDIQAAQTVYGSGVCITPSIGNQPADVTIAEGQSATLSANVPGTGLTYQWYIGTAGDTTTPAPNGASSQLTVSPAATTKYWVRVTACASSDSRTATVTVNCAPPSVSAPLAFPASISLGQSSIISVTPAGSGPFTYQWYFGNSGDTSDAVPGATSSSANVTPNGTTTYWVKVTGRCGTFNSAATTVTVSVSCTAPNITTQPASVSAPIGTAVTLKVVAAVPGTIIHYQWYKGAKGDLSSKVGIDSATFTPSVAGTTSYWVRLTAACNGLPFTDSNAAVVTATGPSKGRAVRH